MKQLFIFLSLFCSLQILGGCSSDIADVFNENNRNAIRPVDGLTELNADPDLYFLALDLFKAAGLDSDGVVLVNHPEMLAEVVVDDRTISWPEFDLSQFSLVVGRFYGLSSGYYLEDQVVIKEGKKIKLFAEIKRQAGVHHGMSRFFVALYPKLPDGEVEFVRWDNY